MNQHFAMGISPMMQQISPQQSHMMAMNQGMGMGHLGMIGPPMSMVHPGMAQQLPPPQQPSEKLDNISKVKSLIGPLRESLSMALKLAAQLLQHNSLTDNGTSKGIESSSQQPPRFDKHLEEFYSICDQIELHLRTSLQCMQQASAAQRYLPVNVAVSRIEPFPLMENGPVSYLQYLATARTQISYAKIIHDSLTQVTPSE